MNLLFRLILYLGIGILLVGVNFWYVSSLINSLFKTSTSIAPFSVIGKKDEDGSLGKYLAYMLAAQVGKIRQEMVTSVRAFESVQVSKPISSTNETLTIPRKITTQDVNLGGIQLSSTSQLLISDFPDPKLTFTFGGGKVEFSGVISWLRETLSNDKVLKFSVHYYEDSALLVGATGIEGDFPIYIPDLEAKDKEIVAALAYTITQREFAKRIPEMGALDLNSFQSLLATLHQAAQLNQQVALGLNAEDGYRQLLPSMEKLADKMPQWKPLLRLTAEMAQNASEIAKAIEYYRMELSKTDRGSPSYEELSSQIEILEQQLLAESKVAGSADVPRANLDSEAILEQLRNSVAGQLVLAQINVSDFKMANRPTIAVLGGLPQQDIMPSDQLKFLPSSSKDQQPDPFMAEYISTLVQTVRLVAPEANFIFQSIPGVHGGASEAAMVRSISDLIASSPDIILITLGPLNADIFEKLFEQAINQGILIVNAAGNYGPDKPIALEGKSVIEKMMVVSATDERGQAAKFTQFNDSTFWAPGVNIPVYLKKNGEGNFSTRSGTSYSSALAAGLAARLLAQEPELSIDALLQTLRNTSRAIIDSNSPPPVLDLGAALQVSS